MGLNDLQHPLCHLIRAETLQHLAQGVPLDFSFAFYCVGLVHNLRGEVSCGRRAYDFDRGTMFFLGPDQLVGHTLATLEAAEGWLLFFHHGYLANHALERDVLEYGFFDYAVNEALHLSEREEATIDAIFRNIHAEQMSPIDRYSKTVNLSNLELMFTYANRAYQRQFITRNDVEHTFVVDFGRLLDRYFRETDLEREGVPNAAYFAGQLNLSPKYLGEKLRVLTGKTAQEHIHIRLTEKGKLLLLQSNNSVAKVAYTLGFEYPHYFSRFFKKRVGVAPSAFRALN